MKPKQVYYEDTKGLRNEIRSLRLYNKRAHKQVVFKEKLLELDFKPYGDYFIADLITDSLFEKVYGKCQILVEINGDRYLVKRILPEDILLDGYRRILDTYKGVPYRNKKDLFKIKYYEGMKNDN